VAEFGEFLEQKQSNMTGEQLCYGDKWHVINLGNEAGPEHSVLCRYYLNFVSGVKKKKSVLKVLSKNVIPLH
jgi:hypothetical protein